MFETKPRAKRVDLLNSLRIAAPCNVAWESMQGGDRVRHCSECNKNVYNISSMSRAEAEEFLEATAQGACVNFYKRADGTVLVDNCPVGLRQLRAQYRKIAAAVATLIAFSQSLLLSSFAGNTTNSTSSTPGCKTSTSPEAQRLGGRPVAQGFDKPAVVAYRNSVQKQLAAAMPTNIDVGNAGIFVTIASDGSIVSVGLLKGSPNEKTDALIKQSVRSLSFPPLPEEYHGRSMGVYYECHAGK